MDITFNNIKAHCAGSRKEIVEVIDILTCTVKGARYTAAYKSGRWNGKRCFYNYRDNTFPAGLVPTVVESLERRDVPVNTYDRRPQIVSGELSAPDLSITLRDYQEEAVRALLNAERGVCKLPTRSGKTAIGIAVLKTLALPSLFIVHQKGLLHQAVEEFWKIGGVKAGVCGNGEWRPAQYTVAMIQTLYSKRGKEECKDLLKEIGAFVIDEVHHAGKRYVEVCNLMPNARYRFGLSATPFMSGKENRLETMGIVGPLVYENKMEKLLDADRIVKAKVYFIPVRKQTYGDEWDEIYTEGVVKNKERNTLIVLAALKMLKKGRRPLILIEKLEHGKKLYNMLSPRANTRFVFGDHGVEDRMAALKELQHGDLEILISSRIFDEGQDIPHLQCCIVAGGYKSAVRSYQRYGRGITKVEGKEDTTIIDFLDLSHPLLEKHSQERLSLCKRERAFDAKVTEIGEI